MANSDVGRNRHVACGPRFKLNGKTTSKIQFLRNLESKDCKIPARKKVHRMAVSTSSSLTYSRRCMAACASLMRMMLSRWRTAMGMPWLMADSLRRSPYTCALPPLLVAGCKPTAVIDVHDRASQPALSIPSLLSLLVAKAIHGTQLFVVLAMSRCGEVGSIVTHFHRLGAISFEEAKSTWLTCHIHDTLSRLGEAASMENRLTPKALAPKNQSQLRKASNATAGTVRAV